MSAATLATVHLAPPRVLVAAARILAASGRRAEAFAVLEEVTTITPDREAIARLQAELVFAGAAPQR